MLFRYEQAESIAGALGEARTDTKLYAGAHAKGWRVFAKDDNGHFWYRITTYRFTNRTEALLFDRTLQTGALEAGAPAGEEVGQDATGREHSSCVSGSRQRA